MSKEYEVKCHITGEIFTFIDKRVMHNNIDKMLKERGYSDWSKEYFYIKVIYKNILVQHKGGGYDGCIFEWNYFLFDNEGKFHNIFSSGSMGIKDEEEAMNYLDEKDKDDYFIYELTKEEDIKDFQKECNEGQVIKLTEIINKIYDEEIMFWYCDVCGKKVTEGIPEGFEGAGGIMIQATLKVCENCHAELTCPECGTFYEDFDEYLDTESGACIYCEEKGD